MKAKLLNMVFESPSWTSTYLSNFVSTSPSSAFCGFNTTCHLLLYGQVFILSLQPFVPCVWIPFLPAMRCHEDLIRRNWSLCLCFCYCVFHLWRTPSVKVLKTQKSIMIHLKMFPIPHLTFFKRFCILWIFNYVESNISPPYFHVHFPTPVQALIKCHTWILETAT